MEKEEYIIMAIAPVGEEVWPRTPSDHTNGYRIPHLVCPSVGRWEPNFNKTVSVW